jgi:hypothetical protein
MTNLLDERIDSRQKMGWTFGHRVARAWFQGAQYEGIANTIVQLIRLSTSGVIAASRAIRSQIGVDSCLYGLELFMRGKHGPQ